MKFLHHPLHALDDAERNFEQIEQAGMYAGSGAPTFVANAGDYYFRKDAPGIATQRIYICLGGAIWTPVLPFNALPPPSGSAATDAANIAAAVAIGGIIVAQACPASAPYLLPNADVPIPDGCGLVGQGNSTDERGGTNFKATGVSSRLLIGGSGPIIGHFQLDGAGVANYPFQIGTTDADAGGQRVFEDLNIKNALLDCVTLLYHQNWSWLGGTIQQAGRDCLHLDGGCGGGQFYGVEVINDSVHGRHGVYMSASILPNPIIGLYQQPSRVAFYGGRSEGHVGCGIKIDNAYGCTFDNFDVNALGGDFTNAGVGITTVNTGLVLSSKSHVFRDFGISGVPASAGASAIFIDNLCEATLDGQCNDYTGFGVNINAGGSLREINATTTAGAAFKPFPA